MNSMSILDSFHAGLLARDLKVVTFYPYTTFVQNRILDGEGLEPIDPFMVICNAVKKKVIDLGCHWDNKVAIEVAIEFPTQHSSNPSQSTDYKSGTMFIGYCDNKWSLGLSIWSPDAKSSTYQSCIKRF